MCSSVRAKFDSFILLKVFATTTKFFDAVIGCAPAFVRLLVIQYVFQIASSVATAAFASLVSLK
jgi:hypothetical protein